MRAHWLPILQPMASVFGHIAASTAIGYSVFPRQTRPSFLILAGFCAFAPDLDVLAFRFGIPYSSEWGHRGWTHSIAFAFVFGSFVALVYHLVSREKAWNINLSIWLIISTLSHPLLDMLTNGGRGCTLWWPFSTERIFFPFRPIQVSPLDAGGFFSRWGIEVLKSEFWWIGIPAIILVITSRALRIFLRPEQS